MCDKGPLGRYLSLFRTIRGGSRLGFSMDSICGQRRK